MNDKAIEVGDSAVVTKGTRRYVGKVTRVTARQFVVVERYVPTNFSLSSMCAIGDPERKCQIITEDEAERIKAEIESDRIRESEEREQERQRELQAEYDALPEPIKLARCLKWLCDCESEKCIAGAPIEHLRAIVNWARENGLTVD